MNTDSTAPEKIIFSFLTQSDHGMILADEEGKIRWLNEETGRLFGYTTDEMTKLSIEVFGLSTETVAISDFTGRDGHTITVRQSAQSASFNNKTWFLLTLIDITAAKPKQTLKSQDTINFPVNTDSAAVNVWSTDSDFNYTFFNENHKTAMKEVWGADITIGSYLPDYLKESVYKKRVAISYKKILNGKTHRSIDNFTTILGEEKYYENFGHPIKNKKNEIVGLMFYTIDITEKMKLENQLKLSISLLESIMNSPEDIHILSIDTEYHYLFFNNAHKNSMMETWNATPELGRNILEVLPDPEHRKRVKIFYDKSLNGEILTDVSEIIDKQGKLNYYSNISAPIMGPDGTITGITVFILNITERMTAEKNTQKSLEEKEILLKEIHHRVKNNIQLITSMINLQMDLVEDEKAIAILQDSLSSVNTIGLIHESLYQGDNLAEIVMKNYCENLLASITDFYNSGQIEISIKSQFDDIRLDINQAIHVGLIINEIVTNSMKHAFRGRTAGDIRLEMRRSAENEIYLEVSDNGIGFPPGIDVKKTETLGLRLLDVFVRQLNGRMIITSDSGFKAEIYFPPSLS